MPTTSPGSPHLIVFGCGYVGAALVRTALARGWRVTALTRNATHASSLRALGAVAVEADLAGDTWHTQIDRGADHVVNCVSSGGGGLNGYWRSYVEGTRSILRWAAPGVPATYLYTGSTSVYPQSGGELVTEDSPTGAGSEAAAPLLETEALVRGASAFRRSFILRLAGIYGPGRHHLLDQLRAGATLFPGTGAHRLNLAHRDDIVAAILACLDAPADIAGGVFNVADDTPAPKGEVAAWLAARLGVAVPAFARDIGSAPPAGISPVRGRSGPVPDRIISNARLKRVLGWRPRHPDYRSGYEAIFAAESAGTP